MVESGPAWRRPPAGGQILVSDFVLMMARSWLGTDSPELGFLELRAFRSRWPPEVHVDRPLPFAFPRSRLSWPAEVEA